MMSFFGLMKNSRSTKIKAQMLKRKKLKTKSPNKKNDDWMIDFCWFLFNPDIKFNHLEKHN